VLVHTGAAEMDDKLVNAGMKGEETVQSAEKCDDDGSGDSSKVVEMTDGASAPEADQGQDANGREGKEKKDSELHTAASPHSAAESSPVQDGESTLKEGSTLVGPRADPVDVNSQLAVTGAKRKLREGSEHSKSSNEEGEVKAVLEQSRMSPGTMEDEGSQDMSAPKSAPELIDVEDATREDKIPSTPSTGSNIEGASTQEKFDDDAALEPNGRDLPVPNGRARNKSPERAARSSSVALSAGGEEVDIFQDNESLRRQLRGILGMIRRRKRARRSTASADFVEAA